jgi:catechol 2,3-dioxygenase-like lactoylglutathione lyase family enzyme
MKIRLQEIEFGTQNLDVSKGFYKSVLGLDTIVDQERLNVFKSGVEGMDFNTSTHLPAKVMVTSFLTDDLQTVIQRLIAGGISFEGPHNAHLGMSTIEFKDPDGYLIRVNQPGDSSPSWLQV